MDSKLRALLPILVNQTTGKKNSVIQKQSYALKEEVASIRKDMLAAIDGHRRKKLRKVTKRILNTLLALECSQSVQQECDAELRHMASVVLLGLKKDKDAPRRLVAPLKRVVRGDADDLQDVVDRIRNLPRL